MIANRSPSAPSASKAEAGKRQEAIAAALFWHAPAAASRRWVRHPPCVGSASRPLCQSLAPHPFQWVHNYKHHTLTSPPPLDKLWDYGKLAESQARFREELARNSRRIRARRLEIQTQIARTQGLAAAIRGGRQRRSTRVLPKLDQAAGSASRVRYFLERGRTRQFERATARAAVALFHEAVEALGATIRCPAPIFTAWMRCTCWVSPRR